MCMLPMPQVGAHSSSLPVASGSLLTAAKHRKHPWHCRRSACRQQAVSRAGGGPAPDGGVQLENDILAFTPRQAARRPPVYVNLNRDLFRTDNSIDDNYLRAVTAGLRALRAVGVEGAVVDCWWGLVEAGAPRQYDWGALLRVLHALRELGLKAKVALNFHAAPELGISLPPWVVSAAAAQPDLLYSDAEGRRCGECLSLGGEELPLLPGGRRPLEAYADFVAAFRGAAAGFLGASVTEAIVGLGPGGQLRYPSTPAGLWQFPGIGQLQCYDRFMAASLAAAAAQAGAAAAPSPPRDAGSYCQWPSQTGFFADAGGWSSPGGSFFLQWYSAALLRHGANVLATARQQLQGSGCGLAARAPGTHWWYHTPSRAAEAVAGVYNPAGRNGYLPLVAMARRAGARLVLCNAEMADAEQPGHAAAAPELQLHHSRCAAAALGVPVMLENSMLRFDEAALGRLASLAGVSSSGGNSPAAALPLPEALLIRSMGDDLFEPCHWREFKAFMHTMHQPDTHSRRSRTSSDRT